jgi:hypothetical protein
MRGWLAVAALTFGLWGAARGTEPECRLWPWPWRTPTPPCPCCPNDYRPKPFPPCPPRVVCGGPNDYTPKPLPCVTPVKCFGKNDYCPKPARFYLPLCTPPWYTCGPGAECGRPAGPPPNPPEPR